MTIPAENVAVLSAYRYRAESVALALTGKSGFKAKALTEPDLEVLSGFGIIVIDLDAAMDSVLDLIRAITSHHPNAKVIVLGVPESEESVLKLAAAGASGYVPPATSSEELIHILHSVRQDEFTCPPHITHALFSHLAYLASSETPSVPPPPILTLRERRVLHLLSQNLTNKEIAAQLCISQYTAKNHVHRILKKLGVRNRSLASRG